MTERRPTGCSCPGPEGPTCARCRNEAIEGWTEMRYANGKPVFAEDGTMLDDKGNRSIFDDVDV